MSKQYDAYKINGEYLIFERCEVDNYGELPEDDYVHKVDDEGEVYDYCGDDVRIFERIGTFNAAYRDDLKKLAQNLLDVYIAQGKELGFGELIVDTSWSTHCFRRSGNWKEEKIYYTFEQSIKWTNKEGKMPYNMRDKLVMLWGMADAAHELGLDIVYDKDFKIEVFGLRAMWKLVD